MATQNIKKFNMNAVVTEHRLDFLVVDWSPLPGMPVANDFKKYRVGSCDGLWQSTKTSYDILSIINSVKGNGHFNDVIQWFEYSCKRDRKDFRFLEVWNEELYKHLVTKRKFRSDGGYNLIKKLKDL